MKREGAGKYHKGEQGQGERGAALLTVLLIVAVIAVLAAHSFDRLAGAVKLTSNAGELSQAKAYLIAAESIGLKTAEEIISLSPDRTTDQGGWNGREQNFPVTGGMIRATLGDGGNCFNINSLVVQQQDQLLARPLGMQQFIRLMRLLEISQDEAARVAAAATDWIDSDADAMNGGAEDDYYMLQPQPYRTSNAIYTDISELRAVKGVTADIYARIRPWLCALPTTDLSPVNVNTLRPDQALLLAMLSPTADIEPVRQFLGRRPITGFVSAAEFWSASMPAGFAADAETQNQVAVATRWFALNLVVEMQNVLVEEQALVDTGRRPARLVHRRRGDGS